MLDPAYFGNRLFSLGAATITLVFFAMVGMFFVLTQYFQFAQGHTPLDAGFRNVPLAITMMILAPRSPAFSQRFGARASICGGLLLTGVGLGIMAALTPASPYWIMVIALVTTATGLSLFMPPSTHIVVTSLPKHKAGVGSAVNDTTREVGAAIGIAVLGTLLTVGYRSGMRSQTDSLPEPAAEVASDSIGAALRVARDLPRRARRGAHRERRRRLQPGHDPGDGRLRGAARPDRGGDLPALPPRALRRRGQERRGSLERGRLSARRATPAHRAEAPGAHRPETVLRRRPARSSRHAGRRAARRRLRRSGAGTPRDRPSGRRATPDRRRAPPARRDLPRGGR